MQVILLEKIVNLGKLGDLVNVKPGYARNYLVPQGLATVATEANIAVFEERRAELEKAEGRLFGSVGLVEISEAFAAKGMTLSKSELQLPEGAFKAIGTYEVAVIVHSEVSFSVNVIVVPE